MYVEKRLGRVFAVFVGFFALTLGTTPHAAPQNGRVVEGAGSIERSGTHTDIRQHSDFLATRWNSFNIAAHESVQAHQPNSSSRLLIRVDGGGATNIAGNYSSNGITILENQNGVQFSRGAIVNVGGLLATSSRISGADGAHWQLNGTGGAVINNGAIVAGVGGVVLAAVKVQNTGDITSKGGDVMLGAGSSFTVDFAGSMVGFEITKAASGASLATTGKIESQGGIVSLSAREAQAVRTNVVSVGGVVKATRMERRGGVVYLSGGDEGIAEVSGDVSASKKVQTTGEYVVVKEGALLKAPEILVGGDFQGKGDVPTAQRTLVEAGALLDAGAKGRVIVWADETTWFDGDIIAPEGFAEVSGKKVLASVNLAGIDMGEFGELLLDPEHINITSSSFFINAQVTGDVFANTPVPGGGPTLWLDVASVNRFKGNLSLEANTSLAVGFGAAINKPVGNLTLIAGVDMRISSSINNGANTLTLIAGKRDSVGQILSFSGTHTLTARTLIINKRGGAFGTNGKFRFDVQTLRLNTPANQTVQGWMIGANHNLILTSTSGTITVANHISLRSRNLTLVAAGNLIVLANINNGANTLSLIAGAGGAGKIIGSVFGRRLTARNVILTQTDAFGTNAPFTFSANTLTLTTRAAQTVLDWMVADNRNLSLTSNAAITLNRNISIGSGNLKLTSNVAITLNRHITIGSGKLTLIGRGGIVLGGSIILTASEVELTGAINTAILGNRNLTITASNFVLLHDDINLGNTGTTTNVLILRGDTGGVRGVGKPKLTAAAVNLIQNNAFGRNSMFEFSNLIRGLVLTTGASQTVENWMTAVNRALALNSRGTITIGGDINTGSGGLTLNGQDIALFATTSLNGNNIEILGPINGRHSLFVTAWSKLTINDDINLTQGVLNLSAGAKIAGVGKPELAASVVILAQGEKFSSSAPFTFAALGVEAFRGVTLLELKTGAQQKVHGWMIVEGRNLSLTSTGGAIIIGRNIAMGAGDIILNGNQGINLEGTAPIALSGANISLAGLLNAENRALSITAASNLTLNGFIVGASNLNLTGNKIVLGGDIALSGVSVALTGAIDESGTKGNDDLTLRATGRLTLNSHINLGTGVLRLKVGERISVPNSDTNITATAAMIEFSHSGVTDQVIGFTADGIATLGNVNFLATVTYTFLNAAKAGGGVDCELDGRACMLGTGADMNLTTDDGSLASDVSITIDIGTGALTFGGDDDITITAPTVIITAGIIDIGARTLTITATGGHLTLNTNIVGTGSGNVNLISESGNLILGAGVQFTLATSPLVLEAGGMFVFQSADETPASNIMASTIKLSGPNLPAIMPSATVITFSPQPSGETSGTIPSWFSNGVDPAAARDCAGQPIICLIQRTNESLKIKGTTLAPTTSLTINIGDGTLTFGGTGLITLKSPSVSISAGMIDLKGRDLTIIADGSALTLTLGADIANGRVVTIGAVSKGLVFSIASARAVAAESILFLSNGPIAVGAALSLNARDALTLSSGLTGNGDLTLGTGSAAVIRLIAPTPIDILAHGTLAVNGAMLTNLMANGAASGLSGVALRAAGDRGRVELNSDIDIRLLDGQTAGELTISSSGMVVLGGAARTIKHAGAITLTGSLTTTANTALTMTAAGDITLNSNIDLGSGALVLTAGQDAGTGDIMNGGGARTLTASTVSLRQDGTFAAGLLVIASDDLTLRTAAAQTVQDWMVASGRTLSLTASGDITIGGDVDAGGGDLTFDGTAIVLGAGLTLTGGAVELSGAIAGTNGLTIDASGDITLNDNIATGDAELTLDSATRINLGAAITLTGGAIMLTGAIDESSSGDDGLTITASGNLTLNDDIDLGAGTLDLNGTNIFLRGSGGARTLAGGSVELTGHLDSRVEGNGASANNIIIRAASGDITINGDITAKGSDGVGEAQPGGRGGDLTLTATSGNITINGEMRASGGAGGDSTDASQSGDGGDGGVIIIEGVNVLVGLINSRGRSAGAFDIDSSGSSGSAGADGRIMITATGGDLTLKGNMDVDGGQIHLTVQGAGAILNDGTTFQVLRLTAGEINLTQMVAFAADDLLAFPRDRGDNILTIRTSAAQIVHSWMIGNEFSLVLISTMAITLEQDFTTNRDITLDGSAIVLMGSRSLMGRTITLTGAVDENDNLTHDNLTLTASRSLNLMSDINVGSGTLILISGEGGTGNLIPRAITLTASTLSLKQDSLFGDNPPYTLAAGIEQLNLTTNKTAAQTLKGWMLVEDRSLSLTAADQITIGVNVDIGNGNLALSAALIMVGGGGEIAANQIMIDGNLSSAAALTLTARKNAAGALTFGANTAEVSAAGQDLTLTANGGSEASIVFSAGSLTLNGVNINLTGMIDESANNRNLTLTSSGTITFNSGINLGTGDLSMSALMISTPVDIQITASPIHIEFTSEDITIASQGYVGGVIRATFSETPVYVFALVSCDTATVCTIGDGTKAIGNVNPDLEASESITIDVGSNALGFGGRGTINITAPKIMITAGTINIGARTLTITANGGTLTLNGVINGSGIVALSAAENLVIMKDIALGAGALTLTAGAGMTGDIGNGGGTTAPTLTAATVSLTQDGAFADNLFEIASATSLTLTTSTDQTVHGWMVGTNRALSLTTTGEITIGRDIATGTSSLTLDGGTLTLSGAARILSGADIALTGALTANDLALTITATGEITINSDINLGAGGDLTLTGTTTRLTGGPTLTARNINLNAVMAAGQNLTLAAAQTITFDGDINLGAGAGGGALMLSAGSRTALAGTTKITAISASLKLSHTSITSENDITAINDSSITFADGLVPSYAFFFLQCPRLDDCIITGTGSTTVSDDLNASRSITITITGDGAVLNFVGSGDIRLDAPTISINVASINLDGRTLRLVDDRGAAITINANINEATQIIATGGTLSLVGARTISGTMIAITAGLLQTVNSEGTPTSHNLTINMTSGLTIATDINVGSGNLILTAGSGDISNGSATRTLTAGSVSLTQTGAFADALFSIASATSLTLTTTTAQTLHGWMAGTNRALSLTAGGDITIGGIVNVGNGNITLVATGGNIVLGAPTTITGAAVTFSNPVDGTTNNRALTITASGDITINDRINLGTGNLTLDSDTNIVLGGVLTLTGGDVALTGAINASANDYNFTITASGDITLNSDINLDMGTLTLTAGMGGTGNIADGAGMPTLTASTVSFTQDDAFGGTALFTFAASVGALNLTTAAPQMVHDWMDEAGRDLSLTSTAAIMIGRDIATGGSNLTLDGDTLTLSGGARTLSGADIELTGALTAPGLALIITAAGDITINDNISLGAGALTLTAGTSDTGNILSDADIETLTASTVSFMQAGAFGDTALFTFATPTLELETAAAQTVYDWMDDAGRDLSLTSTDEITIGRDIATGGGNLTLDGGTLTLSGGARTLSGADIELIGALTAPGLALIITAAGDITINDNIGLGAGALTLTAGADIGNGGGTTAPTLTAATVSLMQAGAFAATARFMFAPSVGALTLTTGDAQMVHDWMVLSGRDLSLTSNGSAITIGRNIEIGTGSLTLSGTALTLTGGARILSGANISLTGATTNAAALTLTATTKLTLNGNIDTSTGNLTLNLGSAVADLSGSLELSGNLVTITGEMGIMAAGDLTISALDNLVVNTDIKVGMNTLRLLAGRADGNSAGETGDIVFMPATLVLQAANFELTQDGALFPNTRPAVFRDEDGMGIPTQGHPENINAIYDGDLNQQNVPWARFLIPTSLLFDQVDSAGNLVIMPGPYLRNGIIEARVDIVINAGETGTVTFAVGLPTDLTLMANEITITAEAINIGEHRTLTITAAGGTLMLNVGAIAAGELSLIAARIEGLSSSLVLNVPTVNLELTGAGSFTARPFVGGSTIATLNIKTRAPQRYRGWMASRVGSGRNLSIKTMGVLTIPFVNINLGEGALTLNGASITFVNARGLTITAGAVSLTGAINQAANNRALRVIATGNITLNSNINLGAGLLSLSTTGIIGNGGAARTIMSRVLLLRQSGAFGDIFTPASRTSSRVNLRVLTAVDQMVHPWMAGLGNGDFSLKGAGVVLTSITTTTALTRSAGTVILRANTITLGAALTGRAVRLYADTIAGDGNNLVVIHATAGDITTTDIAGTGRPALATSVTGFSLTQNSAFERVTLPFTFVGANITSLTLSTRSAQIYRVWMALPGRTVSLTTTGALKVNIANINVGAGNLTLSATGGITFTNALGLTLTATDVSLTGAVSSTNRQLTVAATGVIALNGNITTGTGDITLTAPGATGITLGGNVKLRGNTVTLTGAVNGATGDHSLRIEAEDNITLGGNIDLGMGRLDLRADEDNNGTGNILSGGDAREIMSGDLFLRQAGAFTDTLFTTDSRASSRVTLRVLTAVDQMVHPWMAGLGNGDFFLQGAHGAVMTSITTTAALTRSAGTVILRANTITLGAALTGTAVSLYADTIAGDGNNLVVIHATAGDITATDIAGTGRPALATSVTGFSLTQNSAFERVTLPFTFVRTTITSLTLSTRSAQIYRVWMALPGRTVSLTTTGALKVNIANINVGAGDLTLSADGGITFTNAAGLTIRAGEVVVTGVISAANLSLTIMAQADILVGSMNLGTGRLDLQAGLSPDTVNAITFADGSTIAARRVSLRQDEQFVAASDENGLAETFVLPTGIRPEGVFFSQTILPTTQSWIDIRLFSEGDFVIDTPGVAINIPTSMNSLVSITLNAGDAALTFFDDGGGSNAPITLIAPIVTITAGSIDLAGRALTIIATKGTLTLNVGATITSTASLFLRGDTIVGLGSDITFNVPTLGLTLTGDERSFDVPPFAAESDIGTLDITTRAPLTYRDWMAPAAGLNRNLILLSTTGALTFTLASINLGAGNLTLTSAVGADITFTNPAGLTITVGNLTLTSAVSSTNLPLIVEASGAITLNSDINTGTGGLALSGASIVLGGDVVWLTSGAISLTGAINEMANNRTLRVIATGNITLNSNINLGTGVLSLTTTGSIGNGGSAPGELPDLTASTISLRQAAEFAAIAVFGFTDTSSLTLSRTRGRQTIHPWMQSALTGGSITITAAGVMIVGGVGFDFGANNITLTSRRIVRIGANITTTGNIILTGTASPAIRFENGAREVRGGNITLSGNARSNRALTITASGILTLNDDIDTGTNNLSLTGATIQIGRRGADTLIVLSGGDITLTSAGGIQIGRFNGRGTFFTRGIVANLTVNAQGVLTIAADITVASAAASGGGIVLTGGSIAFGAAARIITGGAIALRGAATGTADLTLTARGTLRVNSSIALTGGTNPALTLMSTAGAVRILADLSTTGDMTLSGATGINLNSGRAKTLSGAAITLNGNARSNRAVTITASSTLTLNNNITVTGATRRLALSGAGAIVTTGRPILTASTVSLAQVDAFAQTRPFRFRPGSLMLITDAAQDVHDWMISPSRDVTITSAGQVRVGAAIGADVLGRDLGVRSLTLVSTGAGIRIEADITITGNITLRGTGSTGIDLSGAARTITGRDITLTGVAMSDANVTITASGILTINNDIDIGTNALTLTSGAGAIVGVGTPTLTASTINLRQAAEFAAIAVFGLTDTSSLTLSRTGGRQTIRPWMQNVLTGGNLTITATGVLIVRGVEFDFGANNITLTSTGGGVRILANISTGGDLTLSGVTGGINLSGGVTGERTLAGATVTLIGVVASNRDLTLTASGTLRFNNNITLNGVRALSLTSTGGAVRILGNITTGGDLTLNGNTGIDLRGGAAKTFSGANITLTGVVVSNRAVTLTASGILRLNNNITLTGTRALSLSGSGGITLGSALTTLSGGAITLRGAATGTADLTITARGTLTINNDITLTGADLTLALSGAGTIGNGGTDTTLTASTVSLRQVDVFDATALFTFGTATGSLVLTTDAAQNVHNWMIALNRNLTVTSSGRVRVAAIIGDGETGRDLGTGDITLTSTEADIRILGSVSTTGDMTLSGATGINLNGGAAGVRTLAGAIITLSGNAWSNRDLTITATGVLTINNNIDIGTGALTLTANPLADTSVALTAGDHIFDPIRACDGSTTPSCTVNTP